MLTQNIDGVDRPIAFRSRSLTGPERNYSVTERETLAVLDALEHWRCYLENGKGRQICISLELINKLVLKLGNNRPLAPVVTNLYDNIWVAVQPDARMLDDIGPTIPSNHSTSMTEYHNFYVTFYDVETGTYVNSTPNATEAYQSFILPWWRQVLWTVLFAGMVVVATVGNLVVIWIVLANKRMRSVTNYFLVNLSVADAMVSTLNVTFNFTYMLNSDWPFGHFYCKFCQFIAVLSISASVFTLLAISVDRYVAIMSPLRPRLGKRATLGITAAIWAWSSIISSPNLIYFTTESEFLPDGSVRRVCFPEWPDGITTRSHMEYVYNVMFMILTYFLPIMAMTFAYSRVGVELWGSQSIGECTQRQLDNVKSKRRVVKMMIVVVVIFAVCWLPFHVYFVVTSSYPDVVNYPHIQEIYLGIYWLAMSNSMYNPIIYCWMNSKFRRGFKQFFWCCGALGGGGLTRHRAFGGDRLDRSMRSLSPSRKNGTSTIRVSMHSTYNNTLVSTA